MSDAVLTLDDLRPCFTGLVPVVLATASSRGVPNVTYVSRVHPVDAERIAVSNQFLSKSSRNLAEVPHASVILMRPDTFQEYRLRLAYERTERRGPIFDRLRNDLTMVAALTGMDDVFRLTAADVYRVVDIEELQPGRPTDPPPDAPFADAPGTGPVGELCGRLCRCTELDSLVRVTVDGLADVLGYAHSQLLLVDEERTGLFTIASHGYAMEGVGAELVMGEGLAGRVAESCTPIVAGNVAQLRRYSRSIRQAFEESGAVAPGRRVPMPGLAHPGSQAAVPVLAVGQLVGVLLVEDERSGRFTQDDLVTLSIVGSVVASAVETFRREARTSFADAPPAASGQVVQDAPRQVHVRHFAVDGSTFLDGEYVIKGVAGKLLWSLLRQYDAEGRTEFTNREVRLDPTLELPDFRDNFESRLILLKRRLDERDAPIRIEKTGRGRFRLVVHATPRLDAAS